MTLYVLKKNLPKKIYNCMSCNKEMDIPLQDCLSCADEFNQKMITLSNSERDPSAYPEHYRKKLSLSKEVIQSINNYYLYLKKEYIISSKRESLHYINKKFGLELLYFHLPRILTVK